MSRRHLSILAVLGCLLPSVLFGEGSLSITNYRLVGAQAISATQATATYTADLMNSGSALSSVTATISSLDPFSIRVVPGAGTLRFAPVPGNSVTSTNDTFSVVVALLPPGTTGESIVAPLDLSKIQWTFQSTALGLTANAGPNQTVKVGQMVTLDGSGSSNPSGAGTLTYSWKLISRPPGSSTVLFNNTAVQPTFVVDAPGNYVIQLTVSNGVDSSSASVTVSTSDTPPVANAGPNQTVTVGTTVFLNGGGSSDADGDPLTYRWSLIAVPAGSQAVLTGPTTVSPKFVADKPGSYTAQLIVNDGLADSLPASVTVTTQNSPPVANAGPTQVVKLGALVQLDGSGSTDVDGDPLTYQWSLITVPAGSKASLSSSTAVKPTFTADVDGTYVAQLIVNDGKVSSTPSTVTITTNAVQPPTANAGPDQKVPVGTLVKLNGTGTDPQNLALTFQWALVLKPAGSAAALSSPSIPNPTFLADMDGTYVVQLIVNNGYLNSAASLATITTASNTAPVANAGPNQNVTVGTQVTLDGSASSDADNDPLTYLWSLLSMPAGSAAVLSGANTVHPTFVVDVAGIYVVQLIVNDGFVNSLPATVVVSTERLSLSPNPLNLNSSPDKLTVTLSIAAGPAGQIVTLSVVDPSIATVPASITVPPGSTTADIPVTPVASGSTLVLATSVGFANASATVNVDTSGVPPLKLAFSPGTVTITALSTQNLTLNLSRPAPAGGLTVNLSSDNVSAATVPSTVTFAAGSTSMPVPVTGVAAGSATIHASALPGIADTTATVTVESASWITLPVGLAVSVGQSVDFPLTLTSPAPPNGVFITLSSSDSGTATVTPENLFIPEGATQPRAAPKVNGIAPGPVTISVSAFGFPTVGQTVQVNP